MTGVQTCALPILAKLGPKAFEQCAGFMRILDGDNPLDATSVHPESYQAAMKLLDKLGLTMEDVRELQRKAAQEKKAGAGRPAPAASARKNPGEKADSEDRRARKKPGQNEIRIFNTNTAMGKALAAAMGGMQAAEEASRPGGGNGKKTAAEKSGRQDDGRQGGQQEENAATGILARAVSRVKDRKQLAEELGIGEITLTDILKELEKPARDPRDDMPRPILRSDVLDMKDLKPGMILKGTVRNVIDFGVFVDIGVHQDGLVHISHCKSKQP